MAALCFDFMKVLLTLQIFYFFFSMDCDFKLLTLSRQFIEEIFSEG